MCSLRSELILLAPVGVPVPALQRCRYGEPSRRTRTGFIKERSGPAVKPTGSLIVGTDRTSVSLAPPRPTEGDEGGSDRRRLVSASSPDLELNTPRLCRRGAESFSLFSLSFPLSFSLSFGSPSVAPSSFDPSSVPLVQDSMLPVLRARVCPLVGLWPEALDLLKAVMPRQRFRFQNEWLAPVGSAWGRSS